MWLLIHRHIGGLESFKAMAYATEQIHRHIGGLENFRASSI